MQRSHPKSLHESKEMVDTAKRLLCPLLHRPIQPVSGHVFHVSLYPALTIWFFLSHFLHKLSLRRQLSFLNVTAPLNRKLLSKTTCAYPSGVKELPNASSKPSRLPYHLNISIFWKKSKIFPRRPWNCISIALDTPALCENRLPRGKSFAWVGVGYSNFVWVLSGHQSQPCKFDRIKLPLGPQKWTQVFEFPSETTCRRIFSWGQL